MKKIIITTLIGLFLIGCAGRKSGTSEDMRVRGDVPEWAGGKTAEDAYYGIGMAKKQNPSLAKQAATGRARTEISQAIDTRVQLDAVIEGSRQNALDPYAIIRTMYLQRRARQIANEDSKLLFFDNNIMEETSIFDTEID